MTSLDKVLYNFCLIFPELVYLALAEYQIIVECWNSLYNPKKAGFEYPNNGILENHANKRFLYDICQFQLEDIDMTLVSEGSERLSSENLPSKPINIDLSQPAHNLHNTFNKYVSLTLAINHVLLTLVSWLCYNAQRLECKSKCFFFACSFNHFLPEKLTSNKKYTLQT